MLPLLLLLNQGYSNVHQKLSCPPSLLSRLCGFPIGPAACVKDPGPLSSWSALFYDNMNFQIPQRQTQMDRVKYASLYEHRKHTFYYCEIWNNYPLTFRSDFHISLSSLCTWNEHAFAFLALLTVLVPISHCSLVLRCGSVCLLYFPVLMNEGSSSWKEGCCIIYLFSPSTQRSAWNTTVPQ